LLAGYCSRAPKNADVAQFALVAHHHLDAQRLGTGAQHVEGLRVAVPEAKKAWLALFLLRRLQKVMASAAAVASSSSEALAIGRPVRSLIRVWKFSSASRRPWEISGWYGV
jgi:hypothetical protein